MPSRSWNTQALILSLSDFASDHRTAVLLVPQDDGICTLLDAAVYGGARSKLRGLVVPYQTGTVWLYSNPVKNTHKITDFSVKSYRFELREDLVRTWCAAVCSEIAVKTCGTLDWYLINIFLDGLCVSSAEECKTALLRFLWRIIHFAGLAPVLNRCTRCGCRLGEALQHSVPAVRQPLSGNAAMYDSFEDACFCTTCTENPASGFVLSGESLYYLCAVKEKPAGYSRSLPLSAQSYGELKRFLFFLTEKMIGSKLRSLQSGEGLL